ncbi:MAG TPA: hypothetical protein VGK49_02410 [Ilumatobacteraceae bacterium]
MDQSAHPPTTPQGVGHFTGGQDLCGHYLVDADEFVLHAERTFGQPTGATVPCVHVATCHAVRAAAVGRMDRAVAEAIWDAVVPVTRHIYFCRVCTAIKDAVDDE